MTAKELNDAINALLDLRTFEPFLLEVMNEPPVHVDHPAEVDTTQLALGGPIRVTRRREPSESKTIHPREVSRVTLLEQVDPAGTEYSYPRFRNTIRSLLRAEPFTPFQIELRSGNKLRVDTPNRLAMSGRFATVIRLPLSLDTFSNAEVVRITPVEAPADA